MPQQSLISCFIVAVLFGKALPEDIIYFDDSQSKVDAAVAAGINGHLFTGVEQFKKIMGL